jgi:formylglycine-generating enzyme required for sulfatase activity
VKEDHLKDYCWYRVNSGGQTHGVGEKKPTRWGLYDMHGNVWEWCQDWYGPYPGGEASDPSGPEGGEYRVNRGGAWKFDGYNCRTAYRGAGRPSNRIDIFGCRVALNIPLTWTQRAAARAELPHALGHAFEIPTEAKDQHGNPIRQGTDKATGLPLEIRHKQTGMHLVFITPGEFLMGSPEGERGRDAEREGTRHKVQLTKPFYLGKYEVTQAEWRRVMPTNPSTFRGERNPVEQVTWPECADFIIRLNERVAARYRRETAGERTHTRSIEGLQAGTSLCYAGLLPEGPILLSAA